MIRRLLFIIFTLISVSVAAQIGGKSTYNFLTLTNSARVAALGGSAISINDDDINFLFENPSLLNANMNNELALNYTNYFTDINYGYAAYARDFKKAGTFAFGINYINYGKFTEANELGIITGEFKAAEYAFNIVYAQPIFDSLLMVGVNFKPILSTLERYTSFGIAADLGITYSSKDKLFTAALVIKNLGTQIVKYTEEYESLPLNIQLGISQKLRHAPFRFTLIADHLETPDLTYTNPNDESNFDPITGEEIEKSSIDKLADQVMRHIIIGAEFIPTKNFFISAGYNYRRRKEMIIETKTGVAGISWGFGLKISHFRISYGRSSYHLAGATNHFSVSTNLGGFYKRKG